MPLVYLKSHHHTRCHLVFPLCSPLGVCGLWSILSWFFVWIHFFACRCPVPVSFVEKTVFVPLYCLCFFVKDQLTVYVGSLIFFLIGNFLIVAKVTCVGKKHNSLVLFRKFQYSENLLTVYWGHLSFCFTTKECSLKAILNLKNQSRLYRVHSFIRVHLWTWVYWV